MQPTFAVTLLVLLALFHPTNAVTAEEDPGACNCELIELSDQEQANGCPAHVKERVCPLYRQALEWKKRLQEQHEQRRQEKRMEPPSIPRSR